MMHTVATSAWLRRKAFLSLCVEQLLQRVPDVGPRPVERAHMVRDYLPLAIDYKRLGHPTDGVGVHDLVLGIEQYRELVPVLGDVWRYHLAALDVLADREHHEVFVGLEVV